MKIKKLSLLTLLTLTACGPGGLFEPMTYGVPESKWKFMSRQEQEAVRVEYIDNEKLRIEQERLSVEKERLKIEKERLEEERRRR